MINIVGALGTKWTQRNFIFTCTLHVAYTDSTARPSLHWTTHNETLQQRVNFPHIETLPFHAGVGRRDAAGIRTSLDAVGNSAGIEHKPPRNVDTAASSGDGLASMMMLSAPINLASDVVVVGRRGWSRRIPRRVEQASIHHGLRDVSHTSFDVQEDDSYTGRGGVTADGTATV